MKYLNKLYARLDRLIEKLDVEMTSMSQDDYEDLLVFYYLSAFSFKDWYCNSFNSGNVRRDLVEDFFNKAAGEKDLKLLADIANGNKHLRLKPRKAISRRNPRIKQSTLKNPYKGVNIFVGEGGSKYSFFIEDNKRRIDLLELAKRINMRLKKIPNEIEAKIIENN